MVALPSPQPASHRRPLDLIEGSLSSRRVARQAPWLAALHKATDGLLLALGGSMLGLTVLTLHWQGQWTQSYERLERSQVLGHRLQESTAQLEQHHLQVARRPGQLIPTSIHRLIHVPAPSPSGPIAPMTRQLLRQVDSGLASLPVRSIRPGY